MKKKNMVIYLLIAALVLGIAIIMFVITRDKPIPETIVSKGNPEDYIIEKYGKGFVLYNGTELICYDWDVKQQWIHAINERDAKLQVNGDYILLYNSNTDKIYLMKKGKEIYSVESGKELLNASVNKKGYAAVLTSDKGYKGQCQVYDDKGKKISEYSYGEKYILGAYIASDNRTLVMNIVKDGTSHEGSIVFADIKSGEILKEITSNNIYSYVYMHEDKVFAIADKTLVCYDKKGNEKWKYECHDKDPLKIKFSGKHLTMILNSGGNTEGNTVLIFNTDGRLLGSCETETAVTAFDTSEGFTAVCVKEEVLLLDKKGAIKGTSAADVKTIDIKLFGKGKRILTIASRAVMKSFAG